MEELGASGLGTEPFIIPQMETAQVTLALCVWVYPGVEWGDVSALSAGETHGHGDSSLPSIFLVSSSAEAPPHQMPSPEGAQQDFLNPGSL